MNPFLPSGLQRNLVLASRSPRRREILKSMAIEFEVVTPPDDAEQSVTVSDPFVRPVACARAKAAVVAREHPGATVIGADTIVLVDKVILEKPRSDDEAREFLHRLSGRTHTVVSGVVVRRGESESAGKEETRVRFRELDDAEIDSYVASGEGRDKAGSYAVQGLGAGLVRSIDGCFYNVVGLPISLLFDLLKKLPS